jgi:hypothetical protein
MKLLAVVDKQESDHRFRWLFARQQAWLQSAEHDIEPKLVRAVTTDKSQTVCTQSPLEQDFGHHTLIFATHQMTVK